MAGDSTSILEVRVRADARAEYMTQITPMVRRQARATILLGVVFGVLFVGTAALGLGLEGELVNLRSILLLIGLSVVPMALVIVGVRRGKQRPELPEVALTITDDEVVLAAIPMFRVIFSERPERRWDRSDVRAEFARGSGFLTQDRIKFITGTGWRRRVQAIHALPLDTSADEILAALER